MNFFDKKFGDKIVCLDGATGSNLALRGMPSGVCPEQWILDNPDVLKELQSEYVQAGADIVYAPTFGGNRIKLAEYGLENRLKEINSELVRLSKEAVVGKALVAGDITMTGKQLYPIGTMQFEELVDIYKEQINVLADAGCDLLVIETMMSLQETRAAVIAAKETCDLPIMATLSFEGDGKTLYGTDSVTAALVLEGLGVDAVGINCSVGPDQMLPLVKAMASYVSVPIIAKPNAGMPILDENGKTVYSMNPEEFSEACAKLIEAGASIIGGCCGTTPEHIGALQTVIEEKHRKPNPNCAENKRILTSEHKSVLFGLDDPFMVIGERINPTGKKALQAELREGKLDMVVNFAVEQEEKGADILDINLGMGGIDEGEMLLKTMYEVMGVSHLPLSIDSSKCDVVERALRIYPGRALVNSVSLEAGKADTLFPLIKKYGAMFILLPLSDEGLPKNLDEKINIIETLLQKAYSYGLTNKDIVVDGLVTTVSANEKAALETLETIAYCKGKGLATVCGLSNISFGLPERSNINSAFLTMAISNGLTMAIANPSQKELMNAIYATDMLMNKTDASCRYIDKITGNTGAAEAKPEGKSETHEDKLRRAVLRGNVSGITAMTEEALKDGIKPEDILNGCLMPAINEVGELFNAGKYFLPQLIASANAMKASIDYLEPYLKKDVSLESAKTVIIATVKGDIHDIGKNLVALMLKNYGYRVIDMGKDVPTEEIIAKAKETDAEIIALSALMTTTMVEMKSVINAAKEAGLKAKIMVGGAVITQEYADEICADGYSKDAAGAVKTADGLTQ